MSGNLGLEALYCESSLAYTHRYTPDSEHPSTHRHTRKTGNLIDNVPYILRLAA